MAHGTESIDDLHVLEEGPLRIASGSIVQRAGDDQALIAVDEPEQTLANGLAPLDGSVERIRPTHREGEVGEVILRRVLDVLEQGVRRHGREAAVGVHEEEPSTRRLLGASGQLHASTRDGSYDESATPSGHLAGPVTGPSVGNHDLDGAGLPQALEVVEECRQPRDLVERRDDDAQAGSFRQRLRSLSVQS